MRQKELLRKTAVSDNAPTKDEPSPAQFPLSEAFFQPLHSPRSKKHETGSHPNELYLALQAWIMACDSDRQRNVPISD